MTAPTSSNTTYGKSFGRAMYTSQGAGMRSYAPKTVHSRDRQWVSVHSMLGGGQKKTPARYAPSAMQASQPYLVKKRFVCYDKPLLKITKDARAGRADEVLTGFYQSSENFRAARIGKGEPINHPNPLSVIPKVPICNSFQLNNRAMGNTIRTLLAGDFSTIYKPEDISSAVAQKLRGHFGASNDQLDSLNAPSLKVD